MTNNEQEWCSKYGARLTEFIASGYYYSSFTDRIHQINICDYIYLCFPLFLSLFFAEKLFVVTSIVCVLFTGNDRNVWTAIEHWIHCQDVGHILIKYKRTQRDVASENCLWLCINSRSVSSLHQQSSTSAATASVTSSYWWTTTTRTEDRKETNVRYNTTHNDWSTFHSFFFSSVLSLFSVQLCVIETYTYAAKLLRLNLFRLNSFFFLFFIHSYRFTIHRYSF